jgi:pyruvate dehydrogenase E2 component (dihydrolipoamide acetyltransferase)
MSMMREIAVPDIGDFKDIPVIEVCVKPGDRIEKDAPLVVLESDKATLDVPSSHSGIVKELRVTLGSRVSCGSIVAILESETNGAPSAPVTTPPPPPAPTDPASSCASQSSIKRPSANSTGSRLPRASPSMRRFARELGVELTAVNGSGPSGRILKTDLQSYVKTAMSNSEDHPAIGRSTALNIAPWPEVDFSKFGRIERAPLSKIRKMSGENLARNWVTIPHVTNFEDADITELEAFRNKLIGEESSGTIKITMLAFLIKAASVALKKFPQFNSSLIGDELVLKHYFHIGFAADTPNGLLVPVIRDVDSKGILQIATELGVLARQARDGKLKLPDMQGGCFTISSLGGIGGTGFTPIINAPEVAILGVTRARTRPIWTGSQFQPRMILPIALSWDHRVIDGAAAARFLSYLTSLLEDFRRIAI